MTTAERLPTPRSRWSSASGDESQHRSHRITVLAFGVVGGARGRSRRGGVYGGPPASGTNESASTEQRQGQGNDLTQ